MNLISANIYKRIFAVIFDHLLINAALLAIYLKLFSFPSEDIKLENNTLIIFILITFAYFIVFESLFGWTLGKKIFKLTLVSEKGNRPSISSVIIRNLLRPIDFTAFYLLGFIFVTYTKNSQRVGDLLAKTVVVESLD